MKKLFALAALSLLLAGCYEYSSGYRVGTIQKFSNKGIICKTWEGELSMQGANINPKTGMVRVFNFTVEDPIIVNKVIEALDKGNRVKLHYTQELIVSPCRAETTYFIRSVEVL